jgi:hypothetical protein
MGSRFLGDVILSIIFPSFYDFFIMAEDSPFEGADV